MDLPFTISSQWLFLLGGIILLSTMLILTFTKRSQNLLKRMQIHIHKRRVSGASTPPRTNSFPQGKRGSISICDPQDYIHTFPPSRRCALQELQGAGERVQIGPEPD